MNEEYRINDGGRAFPVTSDAKENEAGMSLLDYFAGKALSYLMTDFAAGMAADSVAEECYGIAAAMIKKRGRINAKRD